MLRFVALVGSLLAVVAPAPAVAQAIGDATSVVRDVRGVIGGRVSPIAVGDTVYRDQVVRTLADSSAVLTFLDKTGMAIGPSSEVRLDEFVFSGRSAPRTVEAVKGFFRFISGPGEAGHDYKVRTPHATIAVRGTTFDIRVTDNQTTVVLHEGAIDVCNGGACRAVKPGETVDAARGEVQAPRPRAPSDWTFTSTPRKDQRAALEKAEAVLKSSSAASHEAYERRAAAVREAEAAQQAAKAAAQAAQNARLAAAKAEDQARKAAAQAAALQPPAPPPVTPPPAPASASSATPETVAHAPPASPAAAEPARPTAVKAASAGPASPLVAERPEAAPTPPSAPPESLAAAGPPASTTGPDRVDPTVREATASAPAAQQISGAPRHAAFAMPSGTVLTDRRPTGEPILVSDRSSASALASPFRTHDPAIIVAAADPPAPQRSHAVDWLRPLPEARARAGPPLRPG